MPELNFVSTSATDDPAGAAGQALQPYYTVAKPGYNYGSANNPTGDGFLEYGSGTPGSLPFRVDQAGNVTASSVTGLQPSGDESGATDATNIQALLTANAGPVVLSAGNFYIDAALTLVTGNTLRGSGMDSTVINQVNTTVDTLQFTDQRYITISDLMLNGPGSGTGRGIAGSFSAAPLASLDFHNLRIAGFGGRGLYLNTPITSVLKNIRVETCGSDYFYLTGGTSVTLDSCYADTTTVTSANGFVLNGMGYCTLNGCGADGIVGNGSGGGAGYLVSGSSTCITFNSCGNETSAIGFKVTGSTNVTFNACEVYEETVFAFVITSTSTFVTLTSCRERSPSGSPTASIEVGSGCSAVVTNPNLITAASYSTGTTYVITSTGATAH